MAFVAGFGKTNVDLLYGRMPRVPCEGEEIYAEEFSVQLGGGAPATLIQLGRLGVDTCVQTFLGDDMFSSFAKKEFEKNRVRPLNLYGGTGIPVNITSAVITPHDRAFISYSDPCIIGEREMAQVYEASRGAKVVLIHEDFLPIYPQLKKEGSILVYDTGWSENMSLATMREILTLADWYTPNEMEAMRITGESTPATAARVLRDYLNVPVIKLAEKGCLVLEGEQTTIIPVLPGVSCVDSTGAGDAFLAGFVYGLLNGADPKTCICYGNVTGGECVKYMGCLTGYVNESELKERAEMLINQMA